MFTKGSVITRHVYGMPFFMDIVTIAAWELWKVRNAVIYL
jgi:hypothetical protein